MWASRQPRKPGRAPAGDRLLRPVRLPLRRSVFRTGFPSSSPPEGPGPGDSPASRGGQGRGRAEDSARQLFPPRRARTGVPSPPRPHSKGRPPGKSGSIRKQEGVTPNDTVPSSRELGEGCSTSQSRMASPWGCLSLLPIRTWPDSTPFPGGPARGRHRVPVTCVHAEQPCVTAFSVSSVTLSPRGRFVGSSRPTGLPQTRPLGSEAHFGATTKIAAGCNLAVRVGPKSGALLGAQWPQRWEKHCNETVVRSPGPSP